MFLLLFLPLFCAQLSRARLSQSLPDDLYAFPKYRVTFLNGLPLLNETAERWLREGLHGGEPEFLDHPTQWQDPPPFKHIDAGDGTTVGPSLRPACLSIPSLTRGCLSYCKASASQVEPRLHNRIDENGSS